MSVEHSAPTIFDEIDMLLSQVKSGLRMGYFNKAETDMILKRLENFSKFMTIHVKDAAMRVKARNPEVSRIIQ